TLAVVVGTGMLAGALPATTATAQEPEPDPTVLRIAGVAPDANRYGTAAQVATFYPEEVEAVYVTTGESYADALAGAPAASRGMVPDVPGVQATPEGEPAPVLLVKSNKIPQITQTTIDAINPADIIILGGTGAVQQSVEDELNASTSATVTRVGGSTRYETAALLAAEYGSSEKVYVATGESEAFPDALSGSALAGFEGVPVLLTKKDEAPEIVTSTIQDLGATEVVILGGPKAIDADTFTQLGGTSRLAGADRYLTSVEISKAFGYGNGEDAPSAAVVTGRNFPDALAISALAGIYATPVLLVNQPGANDELPDAVLEELDRLSPDDAMVVGGGTAAVSQDVEDELNLYVPSWANTP
ncbi:MAG: cell wall-binding repeat-containing protein, partial [Ornithinimicrobium sp.]